MLPIPAAKKSIPVATIALASSIGANSPSPMIPSSSPPIVPTSASTDTPFACANSTTLRAFFQGFLQLEGVNRQT